MITKNIDPKVLSSSSWVNIPNVYFENSVMWKSVLPILLASILPSFLTSIAIGDDSLSSSFVDNSGILSASDAYFGSYYDTFENILNLLSAFVLVRLARVIGADRDVIIADKIDEACKKFPKNSEFVVVIGMLHCNGVARRLLSSGFNSK